RPQQDRERNLLSRNLPILSRKAHQSSPPPDCRSTDDRGNGSTRKPSRLQPTPGPNACPAPRYKAALLGGGTRCSGPSTPLSWFEPPGCSRRQHQEPCIFPEKGALLHGQHKTTLEQKSGLSLAQRWRVPCSSGWEAIFPVPW